MVRCLQSFFHEDQGQDLIEYTLLLALVVLTSAALFAGSGRSISNVWNEANSDLGQAANMLSPQDREHHHHHNWW